VYLKFLQYRLDIEAMLPSGAAFVLLLGATYISNKYFDYQADSISQKEEARQTKTLIIVPAAMIFLGVLILFLADQMLLPFLLFVPFALLYSIPIGNFRIKGLSMAKNFYTAGAWLFSIVILILYYGGVQQSFWATAYDNVGLFLFVLIYSLLWDIRDISGDKEAGNRTMPVLFGLNTTKVVAVVIAILAWGHTGFAVGNLLVYNIGFLAAAILISKESFPRIFFHGVIYVQIVFLLAWIL